MKLITWLMLSNAQSTGPLGRDYIKRLVELAGMSEHCDYGEQVHTKFEDATIRPDMIIKMPDKRELVVDAKTSTKAYLDAMETSDTNKQKMFLKKHSQNVKDHIKSCLLKIIGINLQIAQTSQSYLYLAINF